MQAKEPRYDAGKVHVSNDWPAIAIQIAVATIFSGVIAYVATNPEQLVQAQTAAGHTYAPTTVMPAPAPAEVPGAPVQVQVANPFDKSEVFEFPSGTSETDAHVAIAKLLTQRARDREQLWARSDHRLKRRANPTQPVAGADLIGAGRESTPTVGSASSPQS